MKCTYCGTENEEGTVFCSNCGMKLEAPPAPGPAAAPAGPSAEGVRCEHCGMMNPNNATVCGGCNQPLVAAPEPIPGSCPCCGFDKNPAAAKFCMNCGTQLSGEPVPPPAPAPPIAAKLVLPSRREIQLSELETIMGRGDFLQDLSPEEAKYISREHLTLTCEGGIFYILDEKSTNGTKVNGVTITGQGKRELNNNDEITLADTVTITFCT